MKKILVMGLAIVIVFAFVVTAFAGVYPYKVVFPRFSDHITLVTGTKSRSPALHKLTTMAGGYDAIKVWIDAKKNGNWAQVTDRYFSYEGSEITIYYNETISNSTELRGRGQNETWSTVTVSGEGYFTL